MEMSLLLRKIMVVVMKIVRRTIGPIVILEVMGMMMRMTAMMLPSVH